MVTPNNTTPFIPETILTEILARLPLRSISRFKSVRKTWKSTIESMYFRRLFLSLHRNSSSSWSLMCETRELVNFHGCETWDLPKSLATYMPDLITGNFDSNDYSSNGLILVSGRYSFDYYVGNPVLQQWVKIPSPPNACQGFGLVTRVDEVGVVLGFKVVMLEWYSFTGLGVCLYSSETGIWTSKELHCPDKIYTARPLSVNGTMYFLCLTKFNSNASAPGELIALDFYSESDHCRVIPLPNHSVHNKREEFQRAMSTSGGCVMFIITLVENGEENLKVWKLVGEGWQSLGVIRLAGFSSGIGSYAPVAMHPFDSDIVFIWSHQNCQLVSCNLRTQKCTYVTCDDDQPDFCKFYLEQLWGSRSEIFDIYLFVLPRWMESIPRPPNLELIDTTSLLSYVTPAKKTKQGQSK